MMMLDCDDDEVSQKKVALGLGIRIPQITIFACLKNCFNVNGTEVNIKISGTSELRI